MPTQPFPDYDEYKEAKKHGENVAECEETPWASGQFTTFHTDTDGEWIHIDRDSTVETLR